MRHSRADVLARAEREFSELDKLVSRLEPADWQRKVPRPETKDPWTVKDALAHIVYWKLHTARVFRGERRPAELRGLDVSRINAFVYQQWRQRSPDEVLAWHHDVHAQVMAAIKAKPEEWFGRRDHHEQWPGDFGSHSEAHRHKDIEAALAT
ncbi:MAG TPA: maleylpyruvate isomerase N-terminal domain-containing protein [Chloroflexota bacterium]|nr:maleylpyruvate isomerase N-terminal domain-containing protein [Chloroflexota bacterium]